MLTARHLILYPEVLFKAGNSLILLLFFATLCLHMTDMYRLWVGSISVPLNLIILIVYTIFVIMEGFIGKKRIQS